MVYVLKRVIGGRSYFYIVKSIRLLDGTVKKLYKFVGRTKPKKINIYGKYFLKRGMEVNANYAVERYSKDRILTPSEIRKIEFMRLGYRAIMKKLDKLQIKDLLDRFTVNFTYESNAIEGNSLTLKDVGIVIFENSVISGKSLREIYETRNSRDVAELVLKGKFKVDHRSIIKMHRLLMRDIDKRTGYKRVPNFILGRNLETSPPEKVYEHMDQLINWYRANSGKIHPLVLASTFHGKFERIHPFEDGNGRVGRFILNVILIDSGYPPLIIRKTTRRAYLACLDVFDNGHEDKLKRFLLEKFKDSYRKFFEVYIRYL